MFTFPNIPTIGVPGGRGFRLFLLIGTVIGLAAGGVLPGPLGPIRPGFAQEASYIPTLDVHPEARTERMKEAWRRYEAYKATRQKATQLAATVRSLRDLLGNTTGVGGVSAIVGATAMGDDHIRLRNAENDLAIAEARLATLRQDWDRDGFDDKGYLLGPLSDADIVLTVAYGLQRQFRTEIDRLKLNLIRWDQQHVRNNPAPDGGYVLGGQLFLELSEAGSEDVVVLLGDKKIAPPPSVPILIAADREIPLALADLTSPCGSIEPDARSARRTRPDNDRVVEDCTLVSRRHSISVNCPDSNDAPRDGVTEPGQQFSVGRGAVAYIRNRYGDTPKQYICNITPLLTTKWTMVEIVDGEPLNTYDLTFAYQWHMRVFHQLADGETGSPPARRTAEPPPTMRFEQKGATADDVNRLLKNW